MATPENPDRTAFAEQIMDAFCERTGVTTSVPPRRYLWTDAFAVCNCLTLHRHTHAPHWQERARQLIDQVHQVLGRHRADDDRTGWISGLPEEEGERHPTAGGLRIGKPLPERRPHDAPNDRVDWDRDGQYYHYLTRWMQALERASAALNDDDLLRQAAELADAAHAAFSHPVDGGKRLYWKMSIDLSRPLVATEGQHDPLDGFATTASIVARLQTGLRAGNGSSLEKDRTDHHARLDAALRDLASMCQGRGWATADALGIGGLLVDALLLARTAAGADVHQAHPLFERALHDAARSLDAISLGRGLEGPASHRLAFRELGLAIGLAAAGRIRRMRDDGALAASSVVDDALERITQHLPLRERLQRFWLDPAHQQADTWTEHEDINAVMLATSLLRI